MSKKMIKDFFSSFAKAEGCNDKNSDACDIAGKRLKNIDKLDLRFNRNKERIFKELFALKEDCNDDCNYCGESDGLQIELGEKWNRNKLNLNPKNKNL